ncbi:MAG: hypothetical protein AAGA56_14675 [Myxococcota bacterium]
MRTLTIFVFALALFGPFGCGPRSDQTRDAQTVVAHQVAVAANEVLLILADAQQAEGMEAIERVVADGGGRLEAEEALDKVRERWGPVWTAAQTFTAAHDRWASTLEEGKSGAETALAAVTSAFCALRAAAESRSIALPPGWGRVCSAEGAPSTGGDL